MHIIHSTSTKIYQGWYLELQKFKEINDQKLAKLISAVIKRLTYKQWLIGSLS